MDIVHNLPGTVRIPIQFLAEQLSSQERCHFDKIVYNTVRIIGITSGCEH